MAASSSMMRMEPSEAPGITSPVSCLGTSCSLTALCIDGLPSGDWDHREIKMELGAGAGLTLNADLAGVLLDDAVGVGERESGAATLARAVGGVRGEERVVDAGDVFGGETAAAIGDGNVRPGCIVRGADLQDAALVHGVFGV